ncbi:MAG: AAA family ATPase [Pusillimonas sp.]
MSTSSSPSVLIIRLLGEARLTLNGEHLRGKLYDKVIALLAYLVVDSDRSHSREQLATLLWPSLPNEAARNNLRQALYYLRQTLGPGLATLLTASRDTVRFSGSAAHCQIDLKTLTTPMPPCDVCANSLLPAACDTCLTELKNRADAYQGEFLEGLSPADAPDFDVWLDVQRQDLRGQAFALAEQLRDAYEAHGWLEPALAYAQRCMELEPWNEAGHRQHMRLLAAKGQHGAAQTFYDSYRANLARDLNVEPEQSTHALFETIHKHGLESGRKPLAGLRQTPAQPQAGRRQVTVLCCHIDFRPGTAGGDPEQLAEPRSLCAAVLRRYAGHITQGSEGYIYAYVGYPEASEQVGRRAAQAALELQASIEPRYRFRAGIHTGVIVTGFDPALPDVIGNVSAAAWRLCRLMSKGGIALSGTTEPLLQGQFQLQALKTLQPRRNEAGNAPAAMLAYKLIRPEPVHAQVGPAARSIPLIGRQAELRRLRKSWRLALLGTPQFLVVRGEAGIGKTRLAGALYDDAVHASATIRHLHCYPEHRHTPLYPVTALFESILGFSLDDTLTTQREKLNIYLQHRHPAIAADAGPVMMALLSIAPPGAPVLPPRLRKQQTLDMLLMLLDSLAASNPLLMIVEDAQWLDMSSMDLLERLIHREAPVPLLTLITARNDFAPHWLTPDSVLELQPLKDPDIARLAHATVDTLSPQTVERIVQRADGIALYAQEMAQIPPEPSGRDDDIPPTLHYLLLARLDAVPQARRVVQLAATIGRKFERGLLQRVAELDEPVLDATLRQLAGAHLISSSPSSDDVFQFRHALIQEVAYTSQIQADREYAHQKVAAALSAHYALRAAQQPGEVARHYTLAGNTMAAIPHWLEAGRRALRVSANAEAGEHLQTGLGLIDRMPRDDERDAMELELLLAQGQALLLLRGYGSEEAARVYDRALTLSRQQTPVKQRFDILWGLWMVSSSRPGSSFLKSWELARELLRLARGSGDSGLLVQAYSAAANIALWRNQIDTACRYALAATAQPDTALDSTLEGLDPRVTSLAHLSWAYWRQGRNSEAHAVSRRSIALARKLDNPDTLCFALGFAAILQRFLGNVESAADYARQVENIATIYQLALWRGIAEMVLAWVQAVQGELQGLIRLRACVRNIKHVMPGVAVLFLHAQAEACGFLGRYDEQLDAIDEGLRAARAVSEGFFRTQLQELRSACLRQQAQHVRINQTGH